MKHDNMLLLRGGGKMCTPHCDYTKEKGIAKGIGEEEPRSVKRRATSKSRANGAAHKATKTGRRLGQVAKGE